MWPLVCYPCLLTLFFTALLEPFFMKVKFDPFYIPLGFMVLLGIYILASEFNLESTHVQGGLFGLLAALCYALRNIMSKKLIHRYNGTRIMLYQVTVVVILLSPTLFFMVLPISQHSFHMYWYWRL